MESGIPPLGYGQSYYTLRSIFFDGVPPPRIHFHLRLFDVSKEVPIGDLFSKATFATGSHNLAHPPGIPSPHTAIFCSTDPFLLAGFSRTQGEKNMEPTPQEAAIFEQWLRKLWRDKDALFERFLATGTFSEQAKSSCARDSGVSVGTGLTGFTSGVTNIPVELHSKWEILDAFGYFASVLAPAVFWALWKRIA